MRNRLRNAKKSYKCISKKGAENLIDKLIKDITIMD